MARQFTFGKFARAAVATVAYLGSLLLWLNGRVAGVSGILGGVLLPKRGDIGWRVAFLAGLVVLRVREA